MKKRHLLFIVGPQSCSLEDPLQAAEKLECNVTLLLDEGLCCDEYPSVEAIRTNLHDLDGVLRLVESLHTHEPFAGVIAYDDEMVPVAARAAEVLGLRGHPPGAAQVCTDKFLMKQRLCAHSLPLARFKLAEGEDDAVQWAKSIGYPVVIKPVLGSASQGVMRADSESDLREKYRRLRRITLKNGLDRNGYSDATQLVERYLDGTEVSVEMLVRNGTPHVLCIFEKPDPLEGPFFEETIYVAPHQLSRALAVEVEGLARKGANALGLRDGAAHCEIRLTSDGPVILEIAARLIGGVCSRVFRYLLGEDIHTYVLRLALGDPFTIPLSKPGHAAGAMMLPIVKEGRLLEVRGTTEAQEVPGIEDVIVKAQPGDPIVPFPEQSCYIGFLTAQGSDRKEVEAALKTAASRIFFHVADLDCELWTREVRDQKAYVSPPEPEIKTLGAYSVEEATERVVPLIASISYRELPAHLAMKEARNCVQWLLSGNRGETSPEKWFIVEDCGVVLGSHRNETCYASCLGVLPSARGRGIGTSLIKAIMGHYSRAGVVLMEAEIDPRDKVSVDYWRRLGFKPQGSNSCCCGDG